MKKFFAGRPLARFALLSSLLPIITLILLIVLAQIPQDIQEQMSKDMLARSSSELCPRKYGGLLSIVFLLTAPLAFLQFHGITGLIFYCVIVNNKALRCVGIKNVAFLVIGSVLTTLAFFFIDELIRSSSHNWVRFTTVAIFQLGSTSILIAVRYTTWKISIKKFLAERPLARFALLSFSLPIITLILLVVFAQIPKDILDLSSVRKSCSVEYDGLLLILFLLTAPFVALQFYGTAGLIFYSIIVNNKALRQVGIKNVAFLVIGSVLTTLAFFFIDELIRSSSHNWVRFTTVAVFQLSSTLILIAVRYTFWKISMMKFFAERPLVRFALLSFSLPIITLILLIILTQMPEGVLYLSSGGTTTLYSRENILFFLISLPVFFQFFGITGLIFYGGIVNNKALTQVGIRNVTLLVIGSVLTTLAIFFIFLPIHLLPYDRTFFPKPFPTIAVFQLISTLALIAKRYISWESKQCTTKG